MGLVCKIMPVFGTYGREREGGERGRDRLEKIVFSCVRFCVERCEENGFLCSILKT